MPALVCQAGIKNSLDKIHNPGYFRRSCNLPRLLSAVCFKHIVHNESIPYYECIGKTERETQNRVIALFRQELGYRYLGNRMYRDGNSNIEEPCLTAHSDQKRLYPGANSRALFLLRVEANNTNRGLYGNNKAVYGLLRYGAAVQTAAGEKHETVHFINWKQPAANDFALPKRSRCTAASIRAAPTWCCM